ncbi:MAG: DUF5706 domain-containing protein [Rhodothermales bacterium]|nr:DUF5706 domain-containing protein [Rhodothermales bacterium]
MDPHDDPRRLPSGPAAEAPAPAEAGGDSASAEPEAVAVEAKADDASPEKAAALTILAEPADVKQVAKAVAKAVEKEKKKAKKKKKKNAALGTDRGIETMFRSAYRTHLNLTSLADAKANMLISINGLILPLILGLISPKIDSNPWLLVPSSVLLVGCLISMVFSIRAARPRINTEPTSLADVRAGVANILFFGNYVGLTRDEFELGLSELMEDTDRLYRNMMRDLYGMGVVLQKKFGLLRTAYTAFMISIVLGVLLFVGTYYLVATGTLGAEAPPTAETTTYPLPPGYPAP